MFDKIKSTMMKVLAVAASVLMTFAGCTPAFAATVTANSDVGNIVISGIEEGLTVNAYQIAKPNYDDAVGEFTGYEMTVSGWSGKFVIDQYGNYTYDGETFDESDLSDLFNAVVGNGVYKSTKADANGDATFEDMEIGSYLFVVTGSESVVYGLVIGSVYYAIDVNDPEQWAIVDGSVDVNSTENLWVKASTPTLVKTETNGSLDDYEHAGSADLGDTLEYHITVGPIPQYEGSYPEFTVVDKIDSDLTITEDEFKAMTISIGEVTLVSGTDYVATQTSDGFTVDFVVDGKYTLNDYVGETLVIDFCADVTSAGDGTEDDFDHTNKATLTYATTSYVMNGNDHYNGTEEDTDHDYTFNVRIQKVDQDDEALAGAVFTLYTDDACTQEYTQNGNAVSATSDDTGYFEFTGLEEGTYYMRETKSPVGYALNTNVYKVVISAVYDGTDDDQKDLTSYTIVVYDETNDSEYVGTATVKSGDATISNTKLGVLPSMGSTGTMIFTIAGCAVVLSVAAVYRKRKAA